MPRKTITRKVHTATTTPKFKIKSAEELLGLQQPTPINDNPLMPEMPCKMLIVGGSGGGKSTIIFNIILGGLLEWTKLYIFSKSINHIDYEALLDELAVRFEEQDADINDYVEAYDDLKHFPDISDFPELQNYDDQMKHLIIVDDFGNDPLLNSEKMNSFMDRCRKKNIQIIMVAHTFTRFAPALRKRFMQFIFLRGSLNGTTAREHAHGEVGDILELKQFSKLYKTATAKDRQFFYVDLMCNHDLNWRFRQNFDKPFRIDFHDESDASASEISDA